MDVIDLLKDYVEENDILFVTWNKGRKNSADLDIYAIVKAPASSRVEMFYDEAGLWHEIFIDTEDDLQKKIANFDEIALNFILELDFAYGDQNAYKKYLDRAAAERDSFAEYPHRRLIILEYRIKVLHSKYKDPSNDALTKKFLLNSLNYHVVSLLLLKHNTLPSSPKRWITQLEKILPQRDKDLLLGLINGDINSEDLDEWMKSLAGDLKSMSIDKSGSENDLTFIS